MKKFKIAITIRSLVLNKTEHKDFFKKCDVIYINKTGQRLSEDYLVSVMSDAEGVIAGTEPFTNRVFESAKNLKVISRIGVGIDNIDMESATQHNVRILTTPQAPVQAVAEHTIALIFCALKKIPAYTVSMKNGDFSSSSGRLLSGKTVGIVGLGRIGYRVAEMLNALGCNINYFDPFTTTNPPISWQCMSNLENLVAMADIISLHANPPKKTGAIIDEKILLKCKKGIIIINTARGTLIDEMALVQALKTGAVSAAGLDVFMREPYTGPLLSFPQVITTPHVASNTIESRSTMELEAFENLLRALEV